jgi:beta-amylase
MLAKHDAIFNFTCLEMITEHQSEESMSRPERLVADAMHACKVAGVSFAGENALPVGWDGHFDQVWTVALV